MKSLIMKLIAGFFALEALLNIINQACYYGLYVDQDLVHRVCPSSSLAGMLSNDSLSDWLVQLVPIYTETAIVIKSLTLIILLIFTSYKLFKREKVGLFLALLLTIGGILITTIDFPGGPVAFVQNIWGGIIVYQLNDLSWFFAGLFFLIEIFIPIYLILNKSKFK